MMRLALVLLVAAAACGGGDPADVAGNYTISVTNRTNGCNFQNWTEGNSAAGIPVVITQTGSDVTASVQGGTAVFLELWLGDSVFDGEAGSSRIELELIGTNSYTSGNCTYTYNALLDGTIDGDALTGRLTYTAATNDQPDCTGIEGCESYQEFNGTRPPT